jgi:hypothetical protein
MAAEHRAIGDVGGLQPCPQRRHGAVGVADDLAGGLLVGLRRLGASIEERLLLNEGGGSVPAT